MCYTWNTEGLTAEWFSFFHRAIPTRHAKRYPLLVFHLTKNTNTCSFLESINITMTVPHLPLWLQQTKKHVISFIMFVVFSSKSKIVPRTRQNLHHSRKSWLHHSFLGIWSNTSSFHAILRSTFFVIVCLYVINYL